MTASAPIPDTIFEQAIAIADAQDRANFLDRACGNDSDLRREAYRLVQDHFLAGSFLKLPAPGLSPTIAPLAAEQPGTLIGPYKLLEQIGEGGMGVVYMAQQTDPVKRKVALKVIKPGMDSKQVIARFEAERQALAIMDHPNIARVFDGGATATGRPYFVMELVRGVPITEYCDHNHLTPRERLELFVTVCHTVQHAHQKGLIHRDLKPSNVLVSRHDTTPIVKIIDFGVAKALGQSLTDKTLFTGIAQMIGTPMYMSPEQAGMSDLDVDTRSDIYALGVLLYELLTGTTPFDKETLSKAGLDEMRRMIREDDPLRPSARVSTLQAQALSTISQRRSTDPRRISATLRGELDWIVMKALEKDRSRRYESASALATDIQRYLSDEPVLACPPTTMYRFQKFARKHKPALVTAAAIAACLILGTTVSAWQAVRATQAEGQAAANEAQAKEKAKEATTQRDEAKALADKLAAKEQQLERTLYAAHMNLAQNAWNAGSTRRVNELLEQYRPKADEVDRRGFEWHYLYKLTHPELLTLKGRVQELFASRCLAYSPDGKRLAFGHTTWNETKNAFGAGELKVCDSKTGRELFVCNGHTGAIYGVAFSPDGKRLASSGDGDVKVWDAENGQELFTLNVQVGGVRSVAFSPDGKRLACAGGIWDNTKKAYVACEVKVWDAQTRQEIVNCKGHSERVWCVTFSPDGQLLASGSNDEMVKVWNSQTGQELWSVKAHSSQVASVAFSPDGKRVFTGGGSEADISGVRAWDAQSGQEIVTFKVNLRTGQVRTGQVDSVALSPDGKRLAISAGLRVLDADTGEELLSLKGHTSGVASVVFNPNGTSLASASIDGTVRVWDVSAKPDVPAFSGPSDYVNSIGFSPDGKRVAGVAQDPMTRERTIKIWDAQRGQELLSIESPKGKSLHRVIISPDGKRLAAGFGNLDEAKSNDTRTVFASGEVTVWDAQTSREIVTFKGHTWPVVDLAFSPNSSRVISCSSNPKGWGSDLGKPCEVKVWDASSGEELLALKGHKSFVNGVAYSPDGQRLATLSRDRTLKVWDALTGRELLSLPVQTAMGGSVVFSPDGKRLASSHTPSYHYTQRQAGEMKLWNAQTGEELLTLPGHPSEVTSIAFSPDGKRLTSAMGGFLGRNVAHEVKLWDTLSGEQLLAFEKIGNAGVAFSPDGNRLVSAGSEGLKIFDATPVPNP